MRRGPGIEVDRIAVVPQCGAFREFIHAGADGQIGGVDAVEFVCIGVDVNQLALGRGQRRDGVAIGGRFPEPRADGEDQVGLFDAFDQRGVGSVAEIAGIDRARG